MKYHVCSDLDICQHIVTFPNKELGTPKPKVDGFWIVLIASFDAQKLTMLSLRAQAQGPRGGLKW